MPRFAPFALFLVGLLCVSAARAGAEPKETAEEERVLDRVLLPDDSVLLVRLIRGTHLGVSRQVGKALSIETFPVEDVLPGAEVVAARACLVAGKDPVLALVARKGDGHAYHFARKGPAGKAWFASQPIFEAAGEPFRIVEIRNPDGDAIEVTFRRGAPAAGRGARPQVVEERVYANCCPGDARTGVEGVDTLVTLMTSDAVVAKVVHAEVWKFGPFPGETPATIAVTLAADGSLDVQDAHGERVSLPAGAASEARLRAALATATATPEWLHPLGSRVLLDLRVARAAPWASVRPLLSSAAGSQLVRVRFGAPGEPEGVELTMPVERGRGGEDAVVRDTGSAALEVTVESPSGPAGMGPGPKGAESRVSVRLPSDAAQRQRALRDLRSRIESLRTAQGLHVDLGVASPERVPYGDVLDVLRASRDAGGDVSLRREARVARPQ